MLDTKSKITKMKTLIDGCNSRMAGTEEIMKKLKRDIKLPNLNNREKVN